MRPALERLAATDRIHAAAVFDTQGGLVDVAGDGVSVTLLARCEERVREGFGDRTSTVARTSYATIARFERGTLVVHCTPYATLIVLADRDVDLSLAGAGFHIAVALNVIGVRATSGQPRPFSDVVATAMVDEVPRGLLRPPLIPKI